jgi:phenylpyruvate tautomerase PptA (4-oxalocrotonate tautomerase family)
VKRITEVMRQELDVKPQALSIAFVEVSREDYARDGILIADREDSAP